MRLITIIAGILTASAVLFGISYAVEALRTVPERPSELAWAPEIPIRYTDIDGVKVRYIKAGQGPNLLLLHTLRTQLDIFQDIIPELAKRFTVYAFDYPGHGWSDIPEASYTPEDFYEWTTAAIDKLDIRDATVAGISIGGTIALVLTARQNPRVVRVIAINPYDYGPAAGGVRSSSLTARLVLTFADTPILGATFMRLRNRRVMDQILKGGLASPEVLPEALAKELYEVGNRPGHYQGFLSLLAHEHLWFDARKEYPAIKRPVLLVYGEEDWALQAEREYTRSLIPGVVMETVSAGGHFLSVDRPGELQQLITRFVPTDISQPGTTELPLRR